MPTPVRISDLNPLATPDTVDLMVVVDMSNTETMRLTLGNLRTFVFAAGINDTIHGLRGGGNLHAAFTQTEAGFVPAPVTISNRFLRDDGTWQTVLAGVTAVGPIGAVPNASASRITGTTLNLEPASVTYGGVVTTGAQTFAGIKTFNDGIVLGTPLPIASGGTGEATAADAINALVPDQTGNNGMFLTTDGSVVSWAVVVSGPTITPGADGEVPYWDTGALISEPQFIYDGSGLSIGDYAGATAWMYASPGYVSTGTGTGVTNGYSGFEASANGSGAALSTVYALAYGSAAAGSDLGVARAGGAQIYLEGNSDVPAALNAVISRNAAAFVMAAGSAEWLRVTATEVTFNNVLADKDVRFAADVEPNLLFLDAGASVGGGGVGAGAVGIGTATPSQRLHVLHNAAGGVRMMVENTLNTSNAYMQAVAPGASTALFVNGSGVAGTSSYGVTNASLAMLLGATVSGIIIQSSAGAPIIIGAGSSNMLAIRGPASGDPSGFIYNDTAQDLDARFEGVGREYLLTVDAGLGRVGINRIAGTHGATLDIDNLAVAESVLMARDNGTPVFTVINGGHLELAELASPSSPAAGYGRLYATSESRPFWMDDSGVEHVLTLDRFQTLSWGASVNLDMAPALPMYRSLALTGDATFTTSNRGNGRGLTLRMTADGTTRNLVFPAGWTWMGDAAPPSLAAGDTGILTIGAFGTADTDVVASWIYENMPVPISGTGADNQVAVWTGPYTQEGTPALVFDGTGLNIGDYAGVTDFTWMLPAYTSLSMMDRTGYAYTGMTAAGSIPVRFAEFDMYAYGDQVAGTDWGYARAGSTHIVMYANGADAPTTVAAISAAYASAMVFGFGATSGSVMERQTFSLTETVFNENSQNFDYRVESESHAHALYLDASLDSGQGRWGFFTNSPGSSVDIRPAAGTASWFNVASTMPSTAAAPVLFDFTGAGTTGPQIGVYSIFRPGYTGTHYTSAFHGINNNRGTGTTPLATTGGDFGFFSYAGGDTVTTTGHRVGLLGRAYGSTTRSFGTVGVAVSVSTGESIGVFGSSLVFGSTVPVGGMFTMGNWDSDTLSIPAGGAVLIADNRTSAVPIFLARDNSATVFAVIDGGQLELAELGAPATPSAGFGRLYAKTDGKIYFLNDGGAEYDLTATGGGGTVTGTGVDNRIAVWSGASSLDSDANLTWTGTQMAVGGAAVAGYMLSVVGDLSITGGGTSAVPLNVRGAASTVTPRFASIGTAGTEFWGFYDATSSYGQYTLRVDSQIVIEDCGVTPTYGSGQTHILVNGNTLLIGHNSGERIRIASTGNVSIGTTADLAQLAVDNGATAESIFVARDNGTAVFTIADYGTVSITPVAGYSANVLAVTAGTLASTIEAFSVSATLSSTAATQYGSVIEITSAGSGAFDVTSLAVSLLSGYTGSRRAMAGDFGATAKSTGTAMIASNYGMIGLRGVALYDGVASPATGNAAGVVGVSDNASSSRGFGVLGKSIVVDGAEGIGVYGTADFDTGTPAARIGGMFSLYGETDSIGTLSSAALIADNGATTSPGMLVRDNGTTIFGVYDGGETRIGDGSTMGALVLRTEAYMKYTSTAKATITSNQNNYPIGNGSFYTLTSDASRDITGIDGGVDGRILILLNTGSNNIVLVHASGSSTSGNQFFFSSGSNITLGADDAVTLIYATVDNKWHVANSKV